MTDAELVVSSILRCQLVIHYRGIVRACYFYMLCICVGRVRVQISPQRMGMDIDALEKAVAVREVC